MFSKLLVLIVAAFTLGACETFMAPPMAKTGALQPETPPPSFMAFFDLGSVALSEQSKTTIAQAAQVYKTRANAKVTVTGYADTVGAPAMNMQLSQRRADAVKAGLVAAGVPAAAITTAASGETSLLVDTGQQTKEPRNRRVVITVN